MGAHFNLLVGEPGEGVDVETLLDRCETALADHDGVREVYHRRVDDGRALVAAHENDPGVPVEPFEDVEGLARAAWVHVSDGSHSWAAYYERVEGRLLRIEFLGVRLSRGHELLDYLSLEHGFPGVYDINGSYA